MKQSLARILRIRELEEEISRMEMEEAARSLEQVSLARVQLLERERAERYFAHRLAADKIDSRAHAQTLAYAALEREAANALVPFENDRRKIEQMWRSVFMEKHISKGQAQTMLELLREQQGQQERRLEQKRLDGWFEQKIMLDKLKRRRQQGQ